MPSLQEVALVAGASRGVGKGVATALTLSDGTIPLALEPVGSHSNRSVPTRIDSFAL
jgi:NAD(P)-dependent dehydrogenase (short-subunit alcohol dehydrogenase family)